MTLHRKLLIGALLVASALVPVATADAQSIRISIGDRPYYTRGPSYWDGNVRYVWVPGHRHRNGRHWVRGRYVVRERRATPLRRLERRHRVHRNILFGR